MRTARENELGPAEISSEREKCCKTANDWQTDELPWWYLSLPHAAVGVFFIFCAAEVLGMYPHVVEWFAEL